ncbi:acetoin reductase [Saccharopolyspora hordei]|uniref:Diacetyl reductase [(S)-acetoin forming] n=1 Tax=Saccharopolyspora hordei TaxID=1838 RepID=A0A853AUR8_9PSEU|nr:acetoin reductase [Saccharopolyspora hordei]NYI86394.1 meso-butanediol dehydrogenase/(S,S)-butanediol dehydrogenase/diacetyl reductase [Saccharopolyspora hordei]
MSDIQGSTDLVTGAAQGIGRAIALRLASDGADVALVDLNEDKLGVVADEVAALGRKAISIGADVSDRDQVHAAVERADRDLGTLRTVVNNAGIVQVKPISEATPADLDAIVGVNVAGVVWGIQAAAKTFVEHGTKGAIINASSIAGHDGFALLSLYSATKFAVRALTQAAAKELAPHHITVNAYCPGVVDTDMWITVDREMAKHTGAEPGATYAQYVDGIALGRAETPQDVAGFVSYLAGPDARYMTGQAPLIDGGLVYR